MDENRQRLLRTMQARLASKGDQALREFRDVYDGFDEQQKQRSLEALIKVAEGKDILA
jgi:hypothetical protein